LQSPASDQQRYWTTLVRFANAQQLDVWLNSEVRRELLREHNELVQSWEHHRLPAAMNWWVFPREDNRRWIDPAGIALLIALYAIEVAVFSRLL
jgi:antibiotic biosynthesis monooxygenase (ABM) superfamily enzyme